MKRILFVASEALPFAASGGLGDVIGSLPAAMRESDPDCDVRVIMPLYDTISDGYRSKMKKLFDTRISLAWREQYCGLFSIVENGVTFYFVDNEYYFRRGRLYGEYDDGERFAFFCKAAVDLLPLIGFFPDIVHAHDWQAALTVIYLKRMYGWKAGYSGIKMVFTIYNIQY